MTGDDEAPRWSMGAVILALVVGIICAVVDVFFRPKEIPAKEPVRRIEMLVENSLQRAQDSIDLASYFDSLRRMDSAALAESFARKAAFLRKKLPVRFDSARVDTVSSVLLCDENDVRAFMASESSHVVREDSSARELELCRFDLGDAKDQLASCRKEKAPSCFWPAVKACAVCGVLGLAGGAVTGDAFCREMSRP